MKKTLLLLVLVFIISLSFIVFSFNTENGITTASISGYNYSGSIATANIPSVSFSGNNYSGTTYYEEDSTGNGAPAPSCGDRTCNGLENCNTCPGDCGICPIEPPKNPPAGGGSPGAVNICTSNYICQDWQECKENNKEIRICNDEKKCNKDTIEERDCTYVDNSNNNELTNETVLLPANENNTNNSITGNSISPVEKKEDNKENNPKQENTNLEPKTEKIKLNFKIPPWFWIILASIFVLAILTKEVIVIYRKVQFDELPNDSPYLKNPFFQNQILKYMYNMIMEIKNLNATDYKKAYVMYKELYRTYEKLTPENKERITPYLRPVLEIVIRLEREYMSELRTSIDNPNNTVEENTSLNIFQNEELNKGNAENRKEPVEPIPEIKKENNFEVPEYISEIK